MGIVTAAIVAVTAYSVVRGQLELRRFENDRPDAGV